MIGNSLLLAFQPADPMRYGIMNEAQLRKSLTELVKDRFRIEKYFRLQNYSADKREYAIERLKQLERNFAGEYQNNGGGSWRKEPWSPDLPRDSEVYNTNYLHILYVYMDQYIHAYIKR